MLVVVSWEVGGLGFGVWSFIIKGVEMLFFIWMFVSIVISDFLILFRCRFCMLRFKYFGVFCYYFIEFLWY